MTTNWSPRLPERTTTGRLSNRAAKIHRFETHLSSGLDLGDTTAAMRNGTRKGKEPTAGNAVSACSSLIRMEKTAGAFISSWVKIQSRCGIGGTNFNSDRTQTTRNTAINPVAK